MNTLESCSVASPQGIDDVCAKFTIDTPYSPFNLTGITAGDTQYVFSFWARYDKNSNRKIIINRYDARYLSSTWTKYSIPLTAGFNAIEISFSDVGTYYIYHPKLEIGTEATDWTPAPEDISDVVTRVTEAETSITTNKNAIELKAEKTEVASSIAGINSNLTNYVEKDGDEYTSIKKSVSTLTQTADNFTMKFQEIDSTFGDQSKYIRYSEDGIEIGYLDDASNTGVSETKKKLKLTLDNDRIAFTSDGEVLGYWDGNYFYTGNIYVETKQQARFGDFAFTPYDDGSLAFVRVGE